jgi:quinol-cytochrome oxidoreductase complex cytochrome b subunit
MSGPSTYVPKSGFEKWLDKRLPIVRLVHDSFVDYPTPRNLNYFWTFGAILSFCLIMQIISGIVLAMHYTPSVDHAFASVQRIERDVPFGWLVQNIHATGASMFFIAVYIHMFRGLYYGSYKAPREVLWIIGVIIYVVMIATAFLGYVLPWGQMSFWGATVITNFFTAIPLVGTPIQQWLMGGFAIENATLNRFFSLHYLLPFVIAGLVVLHVWALHVSGQNNPDGVEVKDKADTVPFTPYATVKDFVAVGLFAIMFALFVFFLPDALGHPDNYIPADPLKTPPHIVPEWYLLPFYAILRAIDFAIGPISAKLGGLILMVGALLVLVLLPWLDTSKVRSMRYRPLARIFFVIFVVVCAFLGWCGAQSPDKVIWQSSPFRIEGVATTASGQRQSYSGSGATIEAAEKAFAKQKAVAVAAGATPQTSTTVTPFQFKVTQLSQILTFYYFAFFLLILPILGLRETPGRVPETIAKAIGAKHAAAAPDREA